MIIAKKTIFNYTDNKKSSKIKIDIFFKKWTLINKINRS